jgi:hypothetical protein
VFKHEVGPVRLQLSSQTCSLPLPSREGKKEGRWNQRKKNHSSDTGTVNNFFRVNLGPSEGQKNVTKSRSTSFAATQRRFRVPKSRSASFAATQRRFRVPKSRSTGFAATKRRFRVTKSRSTSFAATQRRFRVPKSRSAGFAATQRRFRVASGF